MTTDRIQSDFSRECVELFVELTQLFGVPRSVGQIYGLLYASPTPLCFSDFVEQLKISKGSASQGLQFLRSLGAIKTVVIRRSLAGETTLLLRIKTGAPQQKRIDHLPNMAAISDTPRREYFEPELSLRKLISGILQERITPLVSTGSVHMNRLRELAESGGEDSTFYLGRIRQLEIWQRRLTAILPILRMMLGAKQTK